MVENRRMASVKVSINSRDYVIACDNGQEEHLKKLARDVAERFDTLAAHSGQAAENHLLVLTTLILADELHDARVELAKLRRQMENTSHSFERGKIIEMEKVLSKTINEIAGRIEKIAGQIE